MLSFGLLFCSYFASAQGDDDTTYTIQSFLYQWNHPTSGGTQLLDSVDQMVVVFREHYRDIKVAGVEKTNGIWGLSLAPVRASIGRNGLIYDIAKKEGDGCTPVGLYSLGELFTYENNINTKLHYTQTNDQDKWIDDPLSDDYNKHIRGATNAKSFENLLLNSIYYKYCMVIEYNTKPIIKGKGSAIFFHVADDKYKPTAGCVAIAETDMLSYLKWLQPEKRKAIFIIADEDDED
jgi:L,D-peptidoglycan transpeptidase YkuD (ErfK/YbiS/YcfS/YnhG family)